MVSQYGRIGVLLIGKHIFCHWQGHGCQLVSSAVLMTERFAGLLMNGGFSLFAFLRRNGNHARLPCRTRNRWNARKTLTSICEHSRQRGCLEIFPFKYRQVMIDMRVVKNGSVEEGVSELNNSNPVVVDLTILCCRVVQMMHVDGLSFLASEHGCRSSVNRVSSRML